MPDLFSILCTTCKTRLRVRDAGVIGQILACPKCSSMVLVAAPEGWAPPLPGESRPAAVDSNGKGESTILKKPRSATPAALPVAKAIAPPEAAPARAKPGVDRSLKETMSDSHFGDVEAIFNGDSTKPSVKVAEPARLPSKGEASHAEKRRNTPAPPPPAEMAFAPPVPPLPVKPPIDPVPSHTRRVRMIALLAIGGLMGVSMAISAAYFAVTWASKPKEIAGVPSLPASNDPPPPVVDPPPTQPVDDWPDDVKPVEPVTPTPVTPPPVDPPPENPPALPGDPLDIVNDKLPRASDPSDLKKLADQLSGLEDDTVPDASESSEGSSADSPPDVEVPAAPPSRPRPERREVDLAARLADPIGDVNIPGVPLAKILQEWSSFSTIPITLDPDALPWSKATPATPVKVQLKDATLEEVLKEVLKPLRLEAVKLDDQIVVTRSAAIRQIKCPFQDLAGDDAAREQLIDMLTALAAPQSWKSAGGLGSLTPQGPDLVVENTELAYGDVLHVCERLRLARGGTTKSVFPAELFSLERRTVRAAAKLDQPLTLNFSQPTSLVRILDRLAEDTGTQIVVDWQAAGAIGWPPDVDATVTLDGTPLREALVKLLAPMDLTYRVIDAETLQVTTAEALQRKPELEAYPVSDLAGTPGQAAKLTDQIAASLGGTPVLRWDAASKTLFALLPQPDQEKLARLLEGLRSE